jgi:hypothetical protein
VNANLRAGYLAMPPAEQQPNQFMPESQRSGTPRGMPIPGLARPWRDGARMFRLACLSRIPS